MGLIDCIHCEGRGWFQGTASEHHPNCDGSDQYCSYWCPVPVAVQFQCEACGGSGKMESDDLNAFAPERAEEVAGRVNDKAERKSKDELIAGMLAYDLNKEWRCEDAIKPLLSAFIGAMGKAYLPQGGRGKSTLYASARAILQEVGETPEFVTWACEKAKRERLEIKSLYSIEFLVPEWRQLKDAPLDDYWD